MSKNELNDRKDQIFVSWHLIYGARHIKFLKMNLEKWI